MKKCCFCAILLFAVFIKLPSNIFQDMYPLKIAILMIKPHITDTAKYFGKKQSETIAFVLTLLCSPQTWNAILSNQLKSNNVLKNELVQILKFEWFNHHRFRFLNYKHWFSVTDTFFYFCTLVFLIAV